MKLSTTAFALLALPFMIAMQESLPAKDGEASGLMPIVIDETVKIAAPPDRVWDVITDFPRYAEWNPFVVACESTLIVGDPIQMRVQLFEAFAQPQHEVIFEHQSSLNN